MDKSQELSYLEQYVDNTWGCEHLKVGNQTFTGKVNLCHVKVTDMKKTALALTEIVQNTSWIHSMDQGTQRSYNKTASETANELVKVFKETMMTSDISKEFGELMVSIGSARALELIFNHDVIPIAELWKPQKKQNEGFDFHTVCPADVINFGEAKFSSLESSKYSEAIEQAQGFFDEEKHFRDRVHLLNLVSSNAINNLDQDSFGLVAAFSLNGQKPFLIFKNALEKAQSSINIDEIESVYLVGVTH